MGTKQQKIIWTQKIIFHYQFIIEYTGSNVYDNDYVYIHTVGYGHGVGMSQYGANYMAQDGYKYDDILKHYYKGVKIVNKI